ncbi:hypothetical protein AVEN_97601-1 [Araneus ventricosus]|uniref:Uncharacterized protein n=1 Tax=Araneus ventricosus TaxID=182803 RepID=A0A4Y2S1S2_ARAVE|nr:hypothetical protein AVEN_272732-1 [Araneus ventricosus]GBN81225.1 hypothetical protein AVEN_97601-1 [Araneus ventricosus]
MECIRTFRDRHLECHLSLRKAMTPFSSGSRPERNNTPRAKVKDRTGTRTESVDPRLPKSSFPDDFTVTGGPSPSSEGPLYQMKDTVPWFGLQMPRVDLELGWCGLR